MDEALIPDRFLMDSGVFMRAMEPSNPKWNNNVLEAQQCRDLWQTVASSKSNKTILLSTITLLEFYVGPNGPNPPNVKHVEYVGFDDIVAHDMARWCAPSVIKAVMSETGLVRNIVKYDALIVACARFYKAEAIVTLDSDVVKLAGHANVRSAHPKSYIGTLGLFSLRNAHR